MSLVDKPRIISAEIKTRNNYHCKRDVGRPHISGELWVLTDKCGDKTSRYVEVRDGQLLVFPAFSSRRLPEWRLPLHDLNLLPYPLGNPFCFSFSKRDHSVPVAVFQAKSQEDYERWVRTLAAELICQTPFDHVRFLDILGITATLQQQQNQQNQQEPEHEESEQETPCTRSKERGPEPKNTLLREKQQNMINSVVQSSFVKNCLRFKTNAHRKYESHRKNNKQEPRESAESRLAPESEDSEKENNDFPEDLDENVNHCTDNQTEPAIKKGQASYLHSFYRKMKNGFGDIETKDSDCVDGISFRVTSEDCPRSQKYVLPDVVKDLPSPTGVKSSFLADSRTKHLDLKANFSCPNIKYSDTVPKAFEPKKYVRKTQSSCSECDSDDSCSSPGFRFRSVSNLLARCQESENYVPVKDKLMLFESLCSNSEPVDYNLSKVKSRSLHDLGRVQDEHFNLNPRPCQYHSSVTNICGSARSKLSELRKGSSSNLVRNICRYFEHRTSGQVKADQNTARRISSQESVPKLNKDESIKKSLNPRLSAVNTNFRTDKEEDRMVSRSV